MVQDQRRSGGTGRQRVRAPMVIAELYQDCGRITQIDDGAHLVPNEPYLWHIPKECNNVQ